MSGEVLVTGASGFVGLRLVRELLERGERVKAFLRPTSDANLFAGLDFSRLRLVYGDVRLRDSLFGAMRGVKVAYHLAQTVEARECAGEESATLGTRNFLWSAERTGLEKVVVTSSVVALGTSGPKALLSEESEFECAPSTNRDARVKAGALAVCREFARKSSLPVTIVEPGLAVGTADRRPTSVGRVVLDYLGRSPSEPVPLSDSGMNFVAIDDVVNGHLRAMEIGRAGEAYVLGGENLTTREFYALLFELTGLALPGSEARDRVTRALAYFREHVAKTRGARASFGAGALDDVFGRYVFATHEKATRELGYRPRPVFDALRECIAWYASSGLLSPHEARRIRLAPPRARRSPVPE